MAPGTIKAQSKVNPVEILLFLVFLTGFSLSLRKWIDSDAFLTLFDASSPAARAPASLERSAERPLAESSPRLATVTLPCPQTGELNVTSAKVRLQGSGCDQTVTKVIVTNQTTPGQSTPNVFLNMEENQFSTDYFPLIPGTNAISIRRDTASATSTQEVKINRVITSTN